MQVTGEFFLVYGKACTFLSLYISGMELCRETNEMGAKICGLVYIHAYYGNYVLLARSIKSLIN